MEVPAPKRGAPADVAAKVAAIAREVRADKRPNKVALQVDHVRRMHDAGMSADEAIKACVALVGDGLRAKVERMIRHPEWGEWASDAPG